MRDSDEFRKVTAVQVIGFELQLLSVTRARITVTSGKFLDPIVATIVVVDLAFTCKRKISPVARCYQPAQITLGSVL